MPRLCYIVAPSYSGSTLLTFLLNTHPMVATVGELKGRFGSDLTPAQTCSCLESLRTCPFWSQVIEAMAKRGRATTVQDLGTYFWAPSHFLINRLLQAGVRGSTFEHLRGYLLRMLPGARRELNLLLETNRELIDVVLDLQQGSLFVDSSKDCKRLQHMRQADLWDLRVIHLVRDGRGSVVSAMKRTQSSAERAARRWRWAQQQCLLMEAEIPPDRWLRIQYEDLAENSSETMARVLSFLQLPGSPRLDFRGVDHHILGNPMRLDSSDSIRLDDSWRRKLTPVDLENFERIAGKLNRHLGYSPLTKATVPSAELG